MVSLPVIKYWGFINTKKKAWIGSLIRVFQSRSSEFSGAAVFNGAAVSVEA